MGRRRIVLVETFLIVQFFYFCLFEKKEKTETNYLIVVCLLSPDDILVNTLKKNRFTSSLWTLIFTSKRLKYLEKCRLSDFFKKLSFLWPQLISDHHEYISLIIIIV